MGLKLPSLNPFSRTTNVASGRISQASKTFGRSIKNATASLPKFRHPPASQGVYPPSSQRPGPNPQSKPSERPTKHDGPHHLPKWAAPSRRFAPSPPLKRYTLNNGGPNGGATAMAKQLSNTLETGLNSGTASRTEIVKHAVAAETKNMSTHIIFAAMLDAKENNLDKLKNHPDAYEKAINKHFNGLQKEMPQIFKALPELRGELLAAVRNDLEKGGYYSSPSSGRPEPKKAESNTGTGSRPKPSAAGGKPNTAKPEPSNAGAKPAADGPATSTLPAMPQKMASFVNSAQEAIAFVKDQGWDNDNGSYQKGSETLTEQIKVLKESPGSSDAAKKIYFTAARLLHPDKLNQQGIRNGDVIAKSTGLIQALSKDYAGVR